MKCEYTLLVSGQQAWSGLGWHKVRSFTSLTDALDYAELTIKHERARIVNRFGVVEWRNYR